MLRRARTVPVGSCDESAGEHVVDDRVRMPSLPADVVRQFYFAQLAYEGDAEIKRRELQRLFRIFGEDTNTSSSDSSSAASGPDIYVEPWFWHGPHVEGNEIVELEPPKWYLALSPSGVLHIVIRGSAHIEDWLKNLNGKMESESSLSAQYARWDLGGRDLSFHQGFWTRTKEVIEEMESALKSSCARHLGKDVASVADAELEDYLRHTIGSRITGAEFTGHSLGGAVALILHRVWSNPAGKRFRVLRFMLEKFVPEARQAPMAQKKLLGKSQFKMVIPHEAIQTVAFSSPPLFAAKSDRVEALQEWLWNGQKRWKEEIEREELDQFQNAQIVFFNNDPVPRLGFLPTGDQLLHAPVRSVLWLRQEGLQFHGMDGMTTNMRTVFPIPPKVQRRYFSGIECLRRGVRIEDHLLSTFEDFILKLAPKELRRGLSAVTTPTFYVSPQEFHERLIGADCSDISCEADSNSTAAASAAAAAPA